MILNCIRTLLVYSSAKLPEHMGITELSTCKTLLPCIYTLHIQLMLHKRLFCYIVYNIFNI